MRHHLPSLVAINVALMHRENKKLEILVHLYLERYVVIVFVQKYYFVVITAKLIVIVYNYRYSLAICTVEYNLRKYIFCILKLRLNLFVIGYCVIGDLSEETFFLVILVTCIIFFARMTKLLHPLTDMTYLLHIKVSMGMVFNELFPRL